MASGQEEHLVSKLDSTNAAIGLQESVDVTFMTDVKVMMKKEAVTVTHPLQAAITGHAMNVAYNRKKPERKVKVFECTFCGLSFMMAGPFLAHRMKEHSEEEESSSSATSFHTAVGSSAEELQ